MQNMKRINHKLKSLNENGLEDSESGLNSQQSTQEGSSKKNQYMDHNDDFVYQN